MKRLHQFLESGIGRFDLHFFWQLIIAFALVIVLVWGGMLLAGRAALHRLAPLALDKAPALSHLWAARLAAYYGQQGSWEGVGAMLTQYPCGSAWSPWNEEWQMDYVLAAGDGTVVAASQNLSGGIGQPLDQVLRRPELILTVPIAVDGQRVGALFLSPFGHFEPASIAISRALQGLLLAGVAIGLGSLIVGWILSRSMSRPLVNLTAATRAVAAGDLSVRVPERQRGEMGELAEAFNHMAAELARADGLRRNMTADVAHELRTPLSVIRGKLEGVLDGIYPATPEHLEPVLEETNLLTHLVEDLHLLAMAEAGQLALETRPMDVGDLLQDAQVNFGPQADDRSVTLALDVPAGLRPVMADWRRIAQVLGNLVTNALRHTPQGGCVTLSAVAHEEGVEVSVADTGTGIPPEDLPYVFERFWRGDKSRSRAGGGSGLGLAIARQLVELHGGTIDAESAPGQGSTFRFTLPTGSKTRQV